MSCRFKIRLFSILLLVCMVLFMASVAQAGSSHQHHHGKSNAVSPFNKAEKPLYCILNMHQHSRNIPCPHEKGVVTGSELRPDCGTHSGSSSSSSNSIAKDLSKITSYLTFSPILVSQKIGILPYENQQKLLQLIDHPPQRI